jgi:hypothetical protein
LPFVLLHFAADAVQTGRRLSFDLVRPCSPQATQDRFRAGQAIIILKIKIKNAKMLSLPRPVGLAMTPLDRKDNASNVARGVLIDNLRFSISRFAAGVKWILRKAAKNTKNRRNVTSRKVKKA